MGDFVTDARVFENVQRLLVTDANHIASVSAAIVDAEQWVNSELAESLDGLTIPVLPDTPNALQLLALWEASGNALDKVFGGEGKEDSPPGNYWHGRSRKQKQLILGGHIRLVFDGAEVGPASQDSDTNKEPEDSADGVTPVRKYLGYDQAGEYAVDSEGVEHRANIDNDEGASDFGA